MNATFVGRPCLGIAVTELYVAGFVVFSVLFVACIASLVYIFCFNELDWKRKSLVVFVAIGTLFSVIWWALGDCSQFPAGSTENRISLAFQRYSLF